MKKYYFLIIVLLLVFSGILVFAQNPVFYRGNSENLNIKSFDILPETNVNGMIQASVNGGLPLGQFQPKNGKFMVRPEGNQNAGDKGAFIYSYKISETGSYTIDISLINKGTDVTGGDGGKTECYIQNENDEYLNSLVFEFPVPVSGTGEKVGKKETFDLNSGDVVYFVFKANFDGFGDQFEGTLKITNPNSRTLLQTESDIKPLNDFRFYRTLSLNPKISEWTEMPQRQEGENYFAGEGYVPPVVTFNNKKYEFTVRAEGDQLVSDKRGAIVGIWDCPESGNYRIEIVISNLGLDVFGGDGGAFTLFKGTDKSEFMSAVIYSVGIPVSVAGQTPTEKKERIVKLQKGDKLFFRWTAGIDAYADQFKTLISIEKTDVQGEEIIDLGLENTLATIPNEKRTSPLKLKNGLWLGMGLLDGEFREWSADLWKKYLGDITVSPVCDNPTDLKIKNDNYWDYYNNKNITVVPQSWGPSYLAYLIYNNGLEHLWNGEYLGQMQIDADFSDGRISSHDLAMHSKASYNAFRKFVESAMANGGAGAGFCDFTFGWMTYSDQGFNPETLEYMRECLQGKDKGFSVNMNGAKKQIKFKDYCNYYFGGMPNPSDLGFSSWKDYMPVTEEEYSKALDKSVFDQNFMLFDMLTSYLWLTFNDMLGETAVKNGGGFSSMPNPEWFRGSEDFLFGAGLENVFGIWEEFFGCPAYLDGAYNHYPYFKNSTQGTNVGLVMECGDGGNGSIYYSTPDAFLNSYELTASCQADYIEMDFWPNFEGNHSDVLNNIAYRDRIRNLLSYGMGFNTAKEDKIKRLKGDFAVVSSRRHIRIFNPDWQPWSWCLNTNPFTPEPGLMKDGFAFTGISQEGMEFNKNANVFWAANMPTKKNFDAFLDGLKKGKIKNGFLMAEACNQVIDTKMEVREFNEIYYSLGIEKTSTGATGTMEVFGKTVGQGNFAKVWECNGETVATCGGVPIVKKIKQGTSSLYVILVSEYNSDLYKALLSEIKIDNNWYSDNGSVARIYTNDKMKVVGVQSAEVRDSEVFGKEKQKPENTYLSFNTDKESSVFVKFKPGQTITYISFPQGDKNTVVADENGFINLPLKGVQHQIFYCVDIANESELSIVPERIKTYSEVLELK